LGNEKGYEDWKGTYGPIQDNLAKYYQDLSPDFYEVQGLEAFEKEQARAMDQVRQSLAQRGISDSGVAAATDIAFAQSSAAERATIRAQAPTIAANEQLRFLQVGMGQDPSQSMANTLAMQAQQDQQRAYRDEAAAGQAMQSAVSTVGTALSDYARASQNTGTTQPITRDPRY
jgi:preprotein translocase subunit SecD